MVAGQVVGAQSSIASQLHAYQLPPKQRPHRAYRLVSPHDHKQQEDHDEQRVGGEIVVRHPLVHFTRLFRYSSVAARNGTNRLPTIV